MDVLTRGQKYWNDHVCLDRERPCPDIDEIDVIVPYVVPSEPVLNALSGLPGFHKAGQELVIDNVPSWEECGEEYFDFLIKFIIYFHAIRNMKDSKVYLSKEKIVF